MNIHIVAGGPKKMIPDLRKWMKEDSIWIGVDRGVQYLLESNIQPAKAFGDFDSVSAEELNQIKGALPNVDIYPSEKDETDTEIAVKWALEQRPMKILLFGVTGGRLDHFFGNIQLLIKGIQAGITIEIHDLQNILYLVKGGTHHLKKSRNFLYVSFIPTTPIVSQLSLEGFKYPLKKRNIHWGETLCISNELENESGTFSFTDGILMVIRSRDYFAFK